VLCEILDNLVNCMLYTLYTKFHESHLSASNFETGVHTMYYSLKNTLYIFTKSMTSCYSVEGKNVCVSATLKAEFCSFTGWRRHMHQPSVLTSAMVSGPNRHADVACLCICYIQVTQHLQLLHFLILLLLLLLALEFLMNLSLFQNRCPLFSVSSLTIYY
jgi:hypothetical protein